VGVTEQAIANAVRSLPGTKTTLEVLGDQITIWERGTNPTKAGEPGWTAVSTAE